MRIIFKTMLVMTLGFAGATISNAAVFVNGSLTSGNQSLLYKRNQTQSANASVEFGVGPYVRLGYGFEYGYSTEEGYSSELDGIFVPVDDSTIVSGHSIDLTLVLYPGEIFVPFIKGGGIHRQYDMRYVSGREYLTTGNKVYVEYEDDMTTWQAGGGLGIKLNRQFSLRISYILSPGKRMPTDPNKSEADKVLDRKTSIGLSYQL